MDSYGEEFFCLCFERYGAVVGALGGTLAEFYGNIDGFYEHILGQGVINEEQLQVCNQSTQCIFTLFRCYIYKKKTFQIES